jgi:hypothetical protein
MYSRQEASRVRTKFWTAFGQYMKPMPNTGGERINWVNYKTGVKDIYFRMDAGKNGASIAIELHHPDLAVQQEYFEKLAALRSTLIDCAGAHWIWERLVADEDERPISKVSKRLSNVNIFDESDWPAIISFLKVHIVGLDKFWSRVREGFE